MAFLRINFSILPILRLEKSAGSAALRPWRYDPEINGVAP